MFRNKTDHGMKHKKTALCILSVGLLYFFVMVILSVPTTAEPYPEGVAVAFTETDIFDAIADPSVTMIHLGTDIALTSAVDSNYIINPARSSLTIDGQNPYAETEEGKNKIHTLTDRKIDSYLQTLRLANRGSVDRITLQNIDISGQNHYGPVQVLDSAVAAGVELYYENVTYHGPQLTHNRQGSAYYKDCRIFLATTATPSGELCEAVSVTFDGTVSVEKLNQDTHEIIYLLPAAGQQESVTIKAGATVEMTHNQTNTGGMIFGTNFYQLTVEEQATLIYHGKNFTFENLPPGNFVVKPGGRVLIDLSPDATFATEYPPIQFQNLRVEEGATFHLTSSAGYGILPLIGIRVNGSITLENPKSFFLQNGNSRNTSPLIKSLNQNVQLDFAAGQMNVWNTASSGGWEELPDNHFRAVDLKAAINMSAAYTSFEGTSAPKVEIGDWLNAGTLSTSTVSMMDVKTLSAGELPLDASYSDMPSPRITGVTEPGASVRAMTMGEEGQVLWGPVTAPAGSYLIEPDGYLGGSEIEVQAQNGHYYMDYGFDAEGETFHVLYDGNENTSGAPPVDDKVYNTAEEAEVLGAGTLEREGYLFHSWNTRSDGEGTRYREGDLITIEDDVMLYADWEKLYSLTYHENTGEEGSRTSTDPDEYQFGQEISVKTLGELGWKRTGYRFLGWSFYQDNETDLVGDTFSMPEHDISLYAVWQEITYDLTFVKIDGDDLEKVLAGAEFTLYHCTENHEHDDLVHPDSPGCWTPYDNAVSSAIGEVVFPALPTGSYQLVETTAPAGFELPYGQWRIEIDALSASQPVAVTAKGSRKPPAFLAPDPESDVGYRLINFKMTVLPWTGGRGLNMMYVLGAILSAGAFLAVLGISISEKKIK